MTNGSGSTSVELSFERRTAANHRCARRSLAQRGGAHVEIAVRIPILF
jgi:hypothetical protein